MSKTVTVTIFLLPGLFSYFVGPTYPDADATGMRIIGGTLLALGAMFFMFPKSGDFKRFRRNLARLRSEPCPTCGRQPLGADYCEFCGSYLPHPGVFSVPMPNYKVKKVSDTQDGGERFVILHIDPEKANRKGYIASDFSGALTEEQVIAILRPSITNAETAELFKVARAEWAEESASRDLN